MFHEILLPLMEHVLQVISRNKNRERVPKYDDSKILFSIISYISSDILFKFDTLPIVFNSYDRPRNKIF